MLTLNVAADWIVSLLSVCEILITGPFDSGCCCFFVPIDTQREED